MIYVVKAGQLTYICIAIITPKNRDTLISSVKTYSD